MSYRLLGQVLSNKQVVSFVAMDMLTNKGSIVTYNELKQCMLKGLPVDNAEISSDTGKIIGTEGSLDRLAEFSVSGNLLTPEKFSILGVFTDGSNSETGKYLAIGSTGTRYTFTKDELFTIHGQDRGTNFYVKSVNNKPVLSATKGEFHRIPVLGRQTSDLNDNRTTFEPKKRSADKIIGKARPYTVRRNLVKLDYPFRGYYRNPQCYGYSYIYKRFSNEITLLSCLEDGKPAPSLNNSEFMGNVNNGYNSILNIYLYLYPNLRLHNLVLSNYLATNKLHILKKTFNNLNSEYRELKITTKEMLQARKDDGEYLTNYEFNFLIGRRDLSYYKNKLEHLQESIVRLEETLKACNLDKYADDLPIGIKKYAQSGKMSFILFNMKEDKKVRELFPKTADVSSSLNVLFLYYAVKEFAFYTDSWGANVCRVVRHVDSTDKSSSRVLSERLKTFCGNYQKLPDFDTLKRELGYQVYGSGSSARIKQLFSLLSDYEKQILEIILPR